MALAALLVSGCDAGTPVARPTGRVTSAPSGTAVTITTPGFRVRVKVSVVPKAHDPGPIGGDVYEVASLSIHVLSSSFEYGDDYLRFIGRDGRTYRPVEDHAGLASPLPSASNAPAGQSVTGEAAFRVPAGGGQVEVLDAQGGRLFGWAVGN